MNDAAAAARLAGNGSAQGVSAMPVLGGASLPRRKAAPLVFALSTALVLAVAGAAYLHGRGKESTDDAQVEGHIVSVSPRLAGRVRAVLVRDNQAVERGDVLVELDSDESDVEIKTKQAELLGARAQLASADAELAIVEQQSQATTQEARAGVTQAVYALQGTRAGVAQARAEVAAAQAGAALAQANLKRTRELFGRGALPAAELDARSAAFQSAAAAMDRAKGLLEAAGSNILVSNGTLDWAHGNMARALAGPEQVLAARARVDVATARVAQADASLELASLHHSFLQVRAPRSGVVSRRTVEVGQAAAPDRPLLALVATDPAWIVANFKETQIGQMHPGSPAKVMVDSIPGAALVGHVESLAGASGTKFALLPADNASGNFVKVVQRVAVVIALDEDSRALRPGVSAYVTVDTSAK